MQHLVRGYHGTSGNLALNLVEEGFGFSVWPESQVVVQLFDSNEEALWFGYGWYFHEENEGRARRWAIDHYGEEAAAVVCAQLDLTDPNGLDLTQREDRARFEKLAQLYREVVEIDVALGTKLWVDGKAIDLAVSEGLPWVRVLAFTEARSYAAPPANSNVEIQLPSTFDYGRAVGNKNWTSRVIRNVSVQVVVFTPDIVTERSQTWPKTNV